MARALKVYRTAIGFHDAYVAAPSQKTALKAWGSSHDLFARGVAELVTDPALTAEPLARPGEVVKRSRGSAAEQLAALPPDAPATPEAAVAKPKRAATPKPPPKPKPPRDALDAAERAMAEAEARHAEARRQFGARQAALDRERREADRAAVAEAERLAAERERAERAYGAALAAWRRGE